MFASWLLPVPPRKPDGALSFPTVPLRLTDAAASGLRRGSFSPRAGYFRPPTPNTPEHG